MASGREAAGKTQPPPARDLAVRRSAHRGASAFGLALIVALLLMAAACGGSEPAKPSAPETVRSVRVETVRLESVPDEIEAPGSVASAATAQVAARVMGTVVAVRVKEGDAVKAGQVLLELDERELAAHRSAAKSAVDEASAAREEAARGVAAAQANADVMKKTYERFVMLREKKSVSPQEFDEVEAKQRAAQAGLAQAKARQQQVAAAYKRAQSESLAAETMAGYARVSAPFAGVVVRRSVEPGSMIAPGTPLFVVEDTSRYRMEVTVDVESAAGMKRGSRARVELDALPGRAFSGTVAELEAGADPASHTVRARIDLPRDAALRSGLFGRAYFARGERRAVAILAAAVLHSGQLHNVYVLGKDDVARLRMVTLGKTLGDRVEILSGLSEGERYVADPGGRELDGKKVEKGQ